MIREESYRLDPPLLLVYDDPPRRPLHHAGAPGKRHRRLPRRQRRQLRHWTCGLSLSTAGAALAGAGFALVTGAPGWGLAGVLLAAGVVTTWLSAPGGGVGVTLAAWACLLACFWAVGQVDPIAGFVTWLLLLLGLGVGIWRACRS